MIGSTIGGDPGECKKEVEESKNSCGEFLFYSVGLKKPLTPTVPVPRMMISRGWAYSAARPNGAE